MVNPELCDPITHSFPTISIHLFNNYFLKTYHMPRKKFVSEATTENESGTVPTLMKPTALQGVRIKQLLHR